MHILTGSQFRIEELLEIMQLAEKLRRQDRLGILKKVLAGQSVILIFEEPSTRTRLSFEIAVKKLGGHPIILDKVKEKSSLAKGESFEDMFNTFAAFGAKIVIIRQSKSGLPMQLAQFSDQHQLGLHIINAGDGNNEHPTQALPDLYTVWREKKEKLENGELTVAYLGDVKDSRTAHSGKAIFSSFRVKVIAPSSCMEAADEIDVWNLLRFQKERKKIKDIRKAERKYYQRYTLTEEVRRKAKPDALFLHSRPRGKELPTEADEDPRQRYIINFKFSDPWQNQETNGLCIRIALLTKMCTDAEGQK